MRVIREINKGGFGRVEEVELPDGSRVARKVFSPAFPISSNTEYQKLVKRFQREVKVQSSLNSPSFIQILDCDLQNEKPSYLMPLAEKNLLQEIQESKISGITPFQALADVLNALDELHELGYVHRDLKPANILFLDGIWKLSDFGLVLPPNGATTQLTSTDSNWGTAGYCAPEQSVEFRNATPVTDIYAFGCILHDIYGNGTRVPYQRYSASGEIGGIIEKCTEFQPNKRFQSIRALRGALLTLLSASPQISLSSQASDWAASVVDMPNWDKSRLENFLRFITYSATQSDIHTLFYTFNEETFTYINEIDNDLFKTFANIYCDWVDNNPFGWDFCDVLIRRLEKIFELGDIEIKASAVLAAGELGDSHNRWFVMRRVMNMCDASLNDVIARRIVIEIKAREAEQKFFRCADNINKKPNEYHPYIAALFVTQI